MRYVLCLLLSGCSTLGPLGQKAADAYDDVRVGAEFTLCRALSVGAWVRAYGNDAQKAEAWRVLCAQTLTEMPVKP